MRFLLSFSILLLSMSACAICLWAASHLSWWASLLAIWAFSLVNNTPFSLMHEAVHGVAAKTNLGNRIIGVICGWAFPTSFLLQQQAHIGHHQRNRTDEDLYDYYLPHQSKLVRNIWLYCGNLMGLYYVCIVLSNLLYLFSFWAYRSQYFIKTVAPKLGFGAYIKDLVKLPAWAVWFEIVMAFGWQIFLYYLLDLNLVAYLACYAAFALHWSVLQYADHAWSSRDIRNGAWNLKVLPPFRWVALNYHYHLAHHQYPQAPWYELPTLVDKSEQQPSFWRVYFSLYKGVRPAPPMGAPADLAFLFPSSHKQPGDQHTSK